MRVLKFSYVSGKNWLKQYLLDNCQKSGTTKQAHKLVWAFNITGCYVKGYIFHTKVLTKFNNIIKYPYQLVQLHLTVQLICADYPHANTECSKLFV